MLKILNMKKDKNGKNSMLRHIKKLTLNKKQ